MRGYDNNPVNHQLLLDLPFREATGALYTYDVSKVHRPLTMVSAPAWTTLASGLTVLTFDGALDYIWGTAANTVDLNFTTGDYSLGGWLYFAAGGADDKTPLARFLVDSMGWELYHYTNEILTLRHHHSLGATTRTACYSGGWAFGEWWFMGVSRSGASATFYRNGEAVTTTCSAGGLIDPETCNQNFYVGNDTTGINLFKGMPWRPRIWGRELPATEWLQMFETERHWFGV
jgi:hypothetical protein